MATPRPGKNPVPRSVSRAKPGQKGQDFVGRSRQEKKALGVLWLILLISLGIHIVAGVVLGSFVVFQHFFKKETTFEAAPEIVRTIDPRQIEHKVKVQETQESSGRPQIQPRLAANRVSELALPELDIDITPVQDALTDRIMENMPTSGLGTGLGSGVGSGGLEAGVSKVNFFGIQAQGERIMFLVDISRSMVEDDKGGLNGFDVLKNELIEMIDNLNDGSFFNVAFFDSHVDVLFTDGLKLANRETKQQAKDLIARYYRMEEFGTHEKATMGGTRMRDAALLRNFKPPTLEATTATVSSGTTRLDNALLSAFQFKADTIFIIADGSPELYKKLEGRELEALEKERERRSRDMERRREEFLRELERENARRARRGLPPRMVENLPGIGPPKLTPPEVLEYIKELSAEYYGRGRGNQPRIYTVGYAADDEALKFLQSLSREYRGKFRRIRGLARPIRS